MPKRSGALTDQALSHDNQTAGIATYETDQTLNLSSTDALIWQDISVICEIMAPAKLTLSLRVTGVRNDGYHEIDAEMTTLDFGDRLEIHPGGSGVHMTNTAGGRIRPEIDEKDNLVTKALRLAGRTARVKVYKQIPVGAGLGGGSADAAAVLRWAGFKDQIRAAAIGADVAFCLVGGRARVQGIGERVEPMPYLCQQFTLMLSPLSCSTPAVYAAWDEMGGPVGANYNDLEPAALKVVPQLARWRNRLGNLTGETPRLAGSGSTWFVPGAFEKAGVVVTTTPTVTITKRRQ